MRQPQWIQAGIALGNQFHYRKKNPLTHNLVNLSLFTFLVAAVGLIFWLGDKVTPALYLPIGGFLLGVIFFALIILVVHEASHSMFVITRVRDDAKRWNRLFGWMVSIPFGINYARHWEEGHQIHHLHPMEPGDPQVENLLTGRDFIIRNLKMLLIPGYVFAWNPSRKYTTHKWVLPANILFWIGVLSVCAWLISWTVPVVVLIGFQVTGVINQFKGSMEHGGGITDEPNRNLRSRTSFFPFRWLLMPLNISIHFEHHLNYCVPWYDLMAYHRALEAIVPPEVQPEIFNYDVWDQLMGRKGRLPSHLRHLLDVEEVVDDGVPEVA